MNDRTKQIEDELKDNNELKVSLRVYIRFWSHIIKKQLLVFIGYAAFLVGMASFTPVFTYIWTQYIDAASVKKDFTSVFVFLSIYIVIKIIQDFCYFFSMRFMDSINFSSWRVLDKAINSKAVNIHSEYFEIPNVQDKINRAWEFNHGSYIQLYQLGLDSVRYALQAIGIFVSLFIISPVVCGIALITVLPTIISKFISDKISILSNRQLDDDKNECNYYENAKHDQSLIKEIILKNSFDFFQNKYEYKSAEIFTKIKNVEIKKARLLLFEEVVRNIVILSCILFTSYQMIIGAISLGGLAVTFSIIINLIYTLSNLTQNLSSVFTLTYSIKQFYEFMDLDIGIIERLASKKDLNGSHEIEFVNVSYRYPLTDKYVLHNLNLSIKCGQHIAIVGANGSGKTTFVKLLLKLLKPSIGEIKYNDASLEALDCNEYWEQFSTVFQDFSKYKDSLRYNVAISNTNNMLNDEEITKALSQAEFNKDIDIDHMLSKEFGGIELSGGEWQKVALARAIFRSNSIFILDEPTAAIDPIKEIELYQRFAELTKGKTSIFVTHRLGSVLYSDLVLFFHDGEIVECGTHDDLIQQKGRYFEFWNTQSSLYYQ